MILVSKRKHLQSRNFFILISIARQCNIEFIHMFISIASISCLSFRFLAFNFVFSILFAFLPILYRIRCHFHRHMTHFKQIFTLFRKSIDNFWTEIKLFIHFVLVRSFIVITKRFVCTNVIVWHTHSKHNFWCFI